jgi:uncharacterized protein
MRLDDSRRSDNVEDGRGSGFGRRGAGIGIGTIVIVIIGYFMGVNPATLLSLLNSGPEPATAPVEAPTQTEANDPQLDFVRAILGETEDVWSAYFKNAGKVYTPPKLHLFTGGVDSACGSASAAAGPFYCPEDQKVYIDLAFFRQLASEFGAPGEFARAYVIAHEVGHHVQNLLGITDKAARAEQAVGRVGANQVSVAVELQADSSVGDDTLQRRTQGMVVPDSFTHGTSAQRVRWFRRGFDSGSTDNCDTFSAASL